MIKFLSYPNMNYTKFIKELSTYIFIASGSIGLYYYFSKNEVTKLIAKLTAYTEKLEELNAKIIQENENFSERVITHYTLVKSNIVTINDRVNEAFAQSHETELIPQTFEAVKARYQEYMRELYQIVETFRESIEKSSSNFNMEDIFQAIDLYRDYLDTLTLQQHYALVHLIFFIALVVSIINLASVFYSESLIKYLDLETKFPRFSKFFILRRTLKMYYFGWHLSIIFLVLLLLFYFNIRVFLGL